MLIENWYIYRERENYIFVNFVFLFERSEIELSFNLFVFMWGKDSKILSNFSGGFVVFVFVFE